MRDIVLVSYTPIDSPGGVPRWNRDFVSCFPGARHYSWADALRITGNDARQYFHLPEWEMARVLNGLLVHTKKIKHEDIVIVDGFWGLGLESFNVISVAHGIWSHLTKEDVDAGKTPEFPVHNTVQVNYRRKLLAAGGKIVSVSDFITEQMKLQWGFESHVINNSIDLDKFKPVQRIQRTRPLIIHGVTTANKGFDHIDAVKKHVDADVMLLDEAARHFNIPNNEAIAQADLVLHPSAYEGFGYFPLEAMACDVPVVGYDVGFLWRLSAKAKSLGLQHCCPGVVIKRELRSPQETVKVTKFVLDSVMRRHSTYNPREVAQLFSIKRFHSEWKEYLENYEANLATR